MGWPTFFFYISGGISGTIFLYYLYKAKGNLHKTEVLLLAAFRRLPLYYPPGPSPASKNSELDFKGLPEELAMEFAQWFLAVDLREPEGVTRDLILELLTDLGFDESEKACKNFVLRGDGQLEEEKRMSAVSLQASVRLLSELLLPEADRDEEDNARRTSLMPSETVSSTLQALKRRRGALESFVDKASALQASMFSMQGSKTSNNSDSPLSPPETLDAFDDGFDETQQNRMEVSRLERVEEGLLKNLEQRGSLSPAEESRLSETRNRKAALLAMC